MHHILISLLVNKFMELLAGNIQCINNMLFSKIYVVLKLEKIIFQKIILLENDN